jgi:DNA recombination protein RmuC
MVAGPTTIAAILNSYQLGFRTLAIAEQTSHVWELLTTIKGEFGKFGDLLDKTREKLEQATKTIDSASTKSRTIEQKLGKVQQLANKVEKDVPELPDLLDE